MASQHGPGKNFPLPAPKNVATRFLLAGWRSPIHLPSGDELDGSKEIGRAHGRRVEREQRKELESYVQHYGMTVEEAVEEWLSENYNSPSIRHHPDAALLRGVMRDQLMDIARTIRRSASAQSEQRWHDKQDAKQTAFIEKLNPKPGQFAQRAEYTFFKDLRRVVATIPEGKARIVHTDDGTYGGRKGRPISEFPKLAARLAQRFLLACGENCSCGGQCSGGCGDAHVAPPSSNPF
jgi:hypothetical protein